ncbi:MAG: ribbon-helix-helix protein, CopG family [Candidatus Eremiobacteraeota bacterium]|nr:ribbon-helix-helix protein, CopG family [Candidatus Eremiobacteraeota bacterium]MCW5866946.1 ribbon-helix-helix protein, CopG family [Candidatus Eremiobacteraeota bacterium]
MRTTIELSEHQRAQLLELAARRGERGFSKIIQEAVELYLKSNANQHTTIRAALDTIGSFSHEEAADLLETLKKSRSSWR